MFGVYLSVKPVPRPFRQHFPRWLFSKQRRAKATEYTHPLPSSSSSHSSTIEDDDNNVFGGLHQHHYQAFDVTQVQPMQVIGSGAHTTVALGLCTRRHLLVAIKTLRPGSSVRICQSFVADLHLLARTKYDVEWENKLHCLQSIIGALVYIHSMNHTHGNLNSRHVLLDSNANGGVKITGFRSLLRPLPASSVRWTAPEVLVQSSAPSPASSL
ncbi:hypothetical protein H257_11983 [Aphanomyces astaci]|uniref:Protein kinase domain-containing protein n=1 Tax=Aphanomyces astaci TaxID=112090 RepID=W4G0E1_APHAT|nr:hypothetical protein H257_11983 [Aphanomyces astaci]ETV73167.1 hypothetical protein H257_11983 [Aphanomyces astaci]|eukprot:XP_009837372.1 hypothetical protein H257_11983 [Aphanomyces astaci]